MPDTTEEPSPDARPAEPQAAEQSACRPSPDTPPPVNVNLDVVRAELQLLAQTDPESLLKGFLLECRELVRGTANVICNPDYASFHDDYFRTLKGAGELSVQLAEAIARLRPGGRVEERFQRIVVERVERSLSAPGGEGGAGLPKNE